MIYMFENDNIKFTSSNVIFFFYIDKKRYCGLFGSFGQTHS